MKETLVHIRMHWGLFLLGNLFRKLVIAIVEKGNLDIFVPEQYGAFLFIRSKHSTESRISCKKFNKTPEIAIAGDEHAFIKRLGVKIRGCFQNELRITVALY
jgi:hypothetical protein